MLDFLLYIIAGAAVGFVVGLTGVGGGSFMTPILVSLFGIEMAIAVGTDLLYAAITKSGGVLVHRKQKTVDWAVVRTLAYGSLPAALATILALHVIEQQGYNYSQYLTTTLGVMLTLTSAVLLFRNVLLNERKLFSQNSSLVGRFNHHHRVALTFIMGLALGVLVTLSSVGAGAFGAAVLMVLYPKMPMIKVIGTDLAHAVPLTLIAGLGHMLYLDNVNFNLLFGLILGSLPAIWVGTRVANRMNDAFIRPIIAVILMLLGIKYTFF